jgi:hypothetical protein
VNATTLAAVKDWMGEGDLGPAVDDQLNQLIPAVSRAIEGHQLLNRSLLIAERFEVVELPLLRNKRITLRETPIDLTATFKILVSAAHDWTVTEDLIRGTDYVVYSGLHEGYVKLISGGSAGAGSLTVGSIGGPTAARVQYTAGLAATEAALLTAYPQITQAANIWVAQIYRRRETIDSRVEQSTGRTGYGTTYTAGLEHPPAAVRGLLHDLIRRSLA